VIDKSNIASLQGLDQISVVPGGSALAALGSQFSDLYKANHPAYSAMEKMFKANYFGAIHDAESKIAGILGFDRDTLEKKIGAQFVEALTVFDPSHKDILPKSMLFGGSLCVHSDGKVTSGGMQIATAPEACADGQLAEVFAVYSLDFNPTTHHLGLTLKSAGIQFMDKDSPAQTQIGNSLSGLTIHH